MRSSSSERSAAARVLRGAGVAVLGAAWAGTATLAYASMIERHAFRLRHVEAEVLAPGSEPIRVLHLSDFHLMPWQRRKRRWVAALARLEPDLVVNTGDNVGHADALAELREMLAPFKGIPGVVVHGSNDYYGPVFKNPLSYLTGKRKKMTAPVLDHESMDAMLRDEMGWAMLDNSAADVVAAGRRLRWVGLADPHIKRERPEEALAALMRLDAEGPEPDVRLGAVHAPYREAVDVLVRHGSSLVFAGHTHGGQVCVPGYGAIVTNCDLPPAQVKGLSGWTVSEMSDASSPAAIALRDAAAVARGESGHAAGAARTDGLLHVSGGLGTSPFAPFRLAAAPEATLVTLVARRG